MRIAAPPQPRNEVELLDQARDAMLAGYQIAAAIMARAAMETRLRQLYTWKVRMTVPKRFGTKDVIGQLCHHRFIDKQTQRELKRAAAVGNRAAHNSPIDWHEVCELLDTVRGFLAVHADPTLPMTGCVDADTDGDEWKGGVA